MAFMQRYLSRLYVIRQHDHALLARDLAEIFLPMFYPALDQALTQSFLSAVLIHDFPHGMWDMDDILGNTGDPLHRLSNTDNAVLVRQVIAFAKDNNEHSLPLKAMVVLHWLRLAKKWPTLINLQVELEKLFDGLIADVSQRQMLQGLDRIMDLCDGMSLRICTLQIGDHEKFYYRRLPYMELTKLVFQVSKLEDDSQGAKVTIMGLGARQSHQLALPQYEAGDYLVIANSHEERKPVITDVIVEFA